MLAQTEDQLVLMQGQFKLDSKGVRSTCNDWQQSVRAGQENWDRTTRTWVWERAIEPAPLSRKKAVMRRHWARR